MIEMFGARNPFLLSRACSSRLPLQGSKAASQPASDFSWKRDMVHFSEGEIRAFYRGLFFLSLGLRAFLLFFRATRGERKKEGRIAINGYFFL